MSGLGLVVSNLYGDIDRKITFLCPLSYLSEASVHFNVGRSSSRLSLVEKRNVGLWRLSDTKCRALDSL